MRTYYNVYKNDHQRNNIRVIDYTTLINRIKDGMYSDDYFIDVYESNQESSLYSNVGFFSMKKFFETFSPNLSL